MSHPKPIHISDATAGSRGPVYVEEPLCVWPDGNDLGEILSLAGSPLFVPVRQTSEADLTREVRIRRYRQTSQARALPYDATLKETTASPTTYPTLSDGDVAEVTTLETERRWTWRDTAAIGGLAASAVIALSQFILIARP